MIITQRRVWSAGVACTLKKITRLQTPQYYSRSFRKPIEWTKQITRLENTKVNDECDPYSATRTIFVVHTRVRVRACRGQQVRTTTTNEIDF